MEEWGHNILAFFYKKCKILFLKHEMKRLFFFLIGLFLFLLLIVAVVRFIMNTSLYKRITTTPSPLALTKEEEKKDNDSLVFPTQEKAVSSLFTAGLRGEKAAFFLFTKEEDKQSDLLSRLLVRLRNANEFSVEQAVKNANNKDSVLHDILQNFSQTITDGKQALARLQEEEGRLVHDIALDEEHLSTLEKKYFSALDSGDVSQSNALFEAYVQKKKALVEKKARLGTLRAYQKKIQQSLTPLVKKYEYFSRHKKALSCGVDVPPFSETITLRSTNTISSAKPIFPIVTPQPPHMGRGYLLGESVPIPSPTRASLSSSNVLPRDSGVKNIPQIRETGWNRGVMEGKPWEEVPALDIITRGSRI